jgi:hypothetical protein
MAIVKAERKTKILLLLELDEEEAHFIAGIVQNPFDDSEESEVISNFREKLFEALKKHLG